MAEKEFQCVREHLINWCIIRHETPRGKPEFLWCSLAGGSNMTRTRIATGRTARVAEKGPRGRWRRVQGGDDVPEMPSGSQQRSLPHQCELQVNTSRAQPRTLRSALPQSRYTHLTASNTRCGVHSSCVRVSEARAQKCRKKSQDILTHNKIASRRLEKHKV